MQRDERGQVLPLLALVRRGRLGGAAVDRARASTAADAAALAGAAEGRQAAGDLARANGGRVLHYDQFGDDDRVRVAVGAAEATARARRTGGRRLAPPPGREGAAPALLAALARADQVLGGRVPVTAVHPGGLEATVAAGWADRVAAASAAAGLCRAPDGDPLRFRLCS
ncbi:MAG: hypothetical protein QOJ09_1847 [Actinomycetota bacterium]|nr:hypothetical protein [Actinomycetota bacterium]